MSAKTPNRYLRFTPSQRVEHAVMLLSFTVLAVTGLPQKFPTAPLSIFTLDLLGGIELVRVIHRWAATVMMVASIYHVTMVAYRVFVQRVRLTMLPSLQDAWDAWLALRYNLGLTKQHPQMGRFNFEEKAEYWAFVWGTIVMVITGFMMWNPIATAQFLPGQFIPAAKAAHGGEAVLAVLAILVWHFWGVHLKHFNKSMFTGYLTEEQMQQEHALELADLRAGVAQRPQEPVALRKRQQLFYPIAGVASVAFLAGIYGFVTFEKTALETLPAQPTANVFVPQTPTPLPPTPTPPPVGELTWNDYISTLMEAKCTACHGNAAQLSFESYAAALQGSRNGPVIVPGDAEASVLIQAQAVGDHPGQVSPEELERLKQWIELGAPEE